MRPTSSSGPGRVPACCGLIWVAIAGAPFYLPVIIIVTAVVLTIGGFPRKSGVVWFCIGLLALLATIVLWVRLSYDVNRVYAQDIVVTQDPVPDMHERVPFDVASASAARNLQDTVGEASGAKFVGDRSTNGTWTTLVTARGMAQGWEAALEQDLPLEGSGTPSQQARCTFADDARLRHGGALPVNNLKRAIYAKTAANVVYDESDIYAYCEEGQPLVVVPLKKLSGFPWATYSPAGIAVYGGGTGELNVFKEAPDDIDGPTYPQQRYHRRLGC